MSAPELQDVAARPHPLPRSIGERRFVVHWTARHWERVWFRRSISAGGRDGVTFRRPSRNSAIDLVFLLPVLAILAGFLFYPLVYGVVLSVHDTKGFEMTALVGLDHYARAILGDAVFHRSLLNTVLFTGVAVTLQIGIGLSLALLVTDVNRGRTFFVFAFFAPFVLAPVAVGAVWTFLFAPYFGIVPALGSAFGIDSATFAPLADANVALWAIMAAFLWRFVGFAMVVYLAGIETLPREYAEYAVLEGASTFQRIRRVTWPMLWPQTLVLVLLTTIGTLRIFDMVWVMTAGGPQPCNRDRSPPMST
jgi:ABC-type sugar transport system permease subunit